MAADGSRARFAGGKGWRTSEDLLKGCLGTYCNFILSEVQDKPWADKILDGDKGKIENAVQRTLDWLNGLDDENNFVEEAELLAWWDWLVGIFRPIMHRATAWGRAEPHPRASGGTPSATDWLDAPTVATSPDARPLEPKDETKDETKDEMVKDEFAEPTTDKSGHEPRWAICVQPDPPASSSDPEAALRAEFVECTREWLRVHFSDAELATLLGG